MIDFYNSQVEYFKELSKPDLDKFMSTEPSKICWSANLKDDLKKQKIHTLNQGVSRIGIYRPYSKQWLYFESNFVERIGQNPRFSPNQDLENLVISVTGIGASKGFSALITDVIPNLHSHDTGQCFPLYTYEKAEPTDQTTLFLTETGYTKKENIPDTRV